jgi:hypothetical protein
VTLRNAAGPFHIGRSFSGSRFIGQIDGVRVDDVALPAARIAELAS